MFGLDRECLGWIESVHSRPSSGPVLAFLRDALGQQNGYTITGKLFISSGCTGRYNIKKTPRHGNMNLKKKIV